MYEYLDKNSQFEKKVKKMRVLNPQKSLKFSVYVFLKEQAQK